ncbi:MAG: YlmH/Sll1252 family protein [Mycoplasmatales bacterium]
MKNILQHYAQEQKDFIMRCINALDDVNNKDIVRTLGFCEPNLVEIITDLKNHYPDVSLILEGGYSNAEKKKVVLFPKYFGCVDSDIIKYNIKYSNKFVKLEHPQILGTLLNSGFDYFKFGDIIVDDNGIANVVVDRILSETLPYVVTRIANQKIEFVEIDEISVESAKLIEKSVRAKSIRADVFVKVITKTSRMKAQQLINAKLVKINYTNLIDITKIIKENDIISIRGYGRFTIVKIAPTSKGNYNIIYR